MCLNNSSSLYNERNVVFGLIFDFFSSNRSLARTVNVISQKKICILAIVRRIDDVHDGELRVCVCVCVEILTYSIECRYSTGSKNDIKGAV